MKKYIITILLIIFTSLFLFYLLIKNNSNSKPKNIKYYENFNNDADFSGNTLLFSETCYYDYTTKNIYTNLQEKLDNIYEKQRYNEFGSERYAILLLPGIYTLNIKLGYYTSIIGLGKRPRDVQIIGTVEVENQGNEAFPGALNNFFRSCENLTVSPPNGKMMWRVSQACPLRSIQVNGDLYLSEPPGYASGGYMADCKVTGNIYCGIQQQWMARNCNFQKIDGSNWNLVCMGCLGEIGGNKECKNGEQLTTTIEYTPIIASKPYIYWDKTLGKYFVMVPDIHLYIKNVPIWSNGKSLPLDKFYFVKTTDTSDTINDYLKKGINLIYSPGLYYHSLKINKSNTIIIGLGFATIIGNIIIDDDAFGVRISGMLFEAGEKNPDLTLVKIGINKNNIYNKENPSILYDLFARVGGYNDDVICKSMVEVNQNNVLIDNSWLWRADHSKFGGIGEPCKSIDNPDGMTTCGLGPTKAIVDHCLVVNGNNFSIYGSKAEHALKELIIWNGNHGQMCFNQSEYPYDVGASWNYPAIKFGNDVIGFDGCALGIYSYFAKKWNKDSIGPVIDSAIIIPKNEYNKIKNAFTAFLNPILGNGIVKHVINDNGESSSNKNPDSPVWCSFNANNFCKC
jgi:hypothetical protein